MLGAQKKDMILQVNPAELQECMKQKETFVVNIVAGWCPDCSVRQEPNFPGFVQKMEEAGVVVYQCNVQDERLVFLSPEHEALTNAFGGHGYPRTVLVQEGKMAVSKVEVMDALALSMLAADYIKRL